MKASCTLTASHLVFLHMLCTYLRGPCGTTPQAPSPKVIPFKAHPLRPPPKALPLRFSPLRHASPIGPPAETLLQRHSLTLRLLSCHPSPYSPSIEASPLPLPSPWCPSPTAPPLKTSTLRLVTSSHPLLWTSPKTPPPNALPLRFSLLKASPSPIGPPPLTLPQRPSP